VTGDKRHHLDSVLMRESLVDKEVMARTGSRTTVRMLPHAQVVKVGGRSVIDRGRSTLFPLVEAFGHALGRHKLIIGTGGGLRSRHVFSIGIDLGLPTPTATRTFSARCWRRSAWWRFRPRCSAICCRCS
jgi:molybdenum storage protein